MRASKASILFCPGDGTMTRKDVVALADLLHNHNRSADGQTEFAPDHLLVLADFCAAQYPNFNQERWIDYSAGVCGQSDELIFVERDSSLILGSVFRDKLEFLKPRHPP